MSSSLCLLEIKTVKSLYFQEVSVTIVRVVDRKQTKHFEGRSRQAIIDADTGAKEVALIENMLPPKGWVPEHSHASEEIIYCLEGVLDVQYCGIRNTLHTGDSVLVPAHTPHMLSNESDKPVKLLAFLTSNGPY